MIDNAVKVQAFCFSERHLEPKRFLLLVQCFVSLHWAANPGFLNHACVLSSVQFSRSVVSDSLQPHGLQHSKLPCPSPTPGACPNSCPSSRWDRGIKSVRYKCRYKYRYIPMLSSSCVYTCVLNLVHFPIVQGWGLWELRGKQSPTGSLPSRGLRFIRLR